MKEIRSIVNAYNSIDFNSTRAALATVVRVEGSSYRRTGARMLVLDNGTYLGGISGGCLEGDALRRAQKAIMQDRPSAITYDTTQDDDHQIGIGLGCNGIIDVLFTPLRQDNGNDPVKLLSAVLDTRAPRAIASVTASNADPYTLGKMVLYEEDEQFLRSFPLTQIADTVLHDLKQCLDSRLSSTFTYPVPGDAIRIFIEIVLPATHLVIYGGNYDIHPLLRMAAELGWDTTVVANLTKIDKSLFAPSTRLIHSKSAEEPVIDKYTALLLMAHDYKTDFSNLQKALNTPASYIGLLGPRLRSEKMMNALSEKGRPVKEEDHWRIFAPAGLDIGAVNPEEIALSIAAEIRSHFAGRPGMPLRLRPGKIYDS